MPGARSDGVGVTVWGVGGGGGGGVAWADGGVKDWGNGCCGCGATCMGELKDWATPNDGCGAACDGLLNGWVAPNDWGWAAGVGWAKDCCWIWFPNAGEGSSGSGWKALLVLWSRICHWSERITYCHPDVCALEPDPAGPTMKTLSNEYLALFDAVPK